MPIGKEIKILITGDVSRRVDGVLRLAPHGHFVMREIEDQKYEVSGDSVDTYVLTHKQVTTYVEKDRLSFPDSDWP
jgi:hypothetical protein